MIKSIVFQAKVANYYFTRNGGISLLTQEIRILETARIKHYGHFKMYGYFLKKFKLKYN